MGAAQSQRQYNEVRHGGQRTWSWQETPRKHINYGTNMQTAVSSEGAHRVPTQVQAHAHKTIHCVGGLSADRQVISVADAAAVKPRVPKTEERAHEANRRLFAE